jgi:hypothetical protein
MWAIGLVIFQIRFNVNHPELASFMRSYGVLGYSPNKEDSDRLQLANSFFSEIQKKWKCMNSFI